MAKATRSLAGKVFAPPVASRGIGRAPAAALISQGARVAVGDIEARPVGSQEAVRAVAQRLAEAGERTRDRMLRLGQLDLASQDVLIQVLRELEKQLWMVRVQFSRGEE